MCGEGVGQKRQYMFTKGRLFRETRSNKASFRSFYSIFDQNTLLKTLQTNRKCGQEFSAERIEMGFKVLKVTMSPRYIWTTRRMHKTKYSE